MLRKGNVDILPVKIERCKMKDNWIFTTAMGPIDNPKNLPTSVV